MAFRRRMIAGALLLCMLSVGRAAEDDVFQILTLENYPPYAYRDSDSVIKGVSVELTRALFSRLGKRFSIKALPWARALFMMENGEADAIVNVLEVEERKRFLLFPKEVFLTESVVLFGQRNSKLSYSNDLTILRGRTVGVMRAFSVGPKLDRAFHDGSLIRQEAKSQKALLEMLMAGRVDIIAGDASAIEFAASQLSLADLIRQIGPPVESSPTYLALAKQPWAADMAERIDEELLRMKRDGTFAGILARYPGTSTDR